ncbi:LpqB family beta-propeller domain-containing protein [Cryptosporangium sp. NPDC051539]|uniref:LpqB family beta-propeller domain-containing protein n=1 Tax=Cryptosporangium sp. NPDC051539 TaxID=3363962 RepID=UPI0037AE2CFF
MVRPGVLTLAVVALLSTALVGCAHVPDSGPAVPIAIPGASQSSEAELGSVNTQLPDPTDDAEKSVGAYVSALVNTRNPVSLGDKYLAAQTRNAFNQNPSTVVVRGDIQTAVAPALNGSDATTATFRAELVGTVDSGGIFREQENPDWQVQVRIVKVKGVWLFAEPPPIIVTADRFKDSFPPYTVYYAAAPSAITGTNPRLVVPEIRYVNEDIGSQPNQIVDFVLSGPSTELSRVAQNPMEKIKRTRRVAFENGDLIIELEPEAESVDKDALNAFVAEVGWSLSSSFQGAVRLLVGGRPLDVKGFSATQPQSLWRRYNPAVVNRNLPSFYVKNGAVQILSPAGAVDPDRPKLKRPVVMKGVHSAAVSLDLTRMAVVRDEPGGGQRLWIADATGFLQPTLRAPEIGRPSWGGGRATVAVPIDGRVYQVGVGNAAHPTEIRVVAPGGSRLTDVTSFRLSLDGVRALLINGTGSSARLYYGTLTGSTGGALVLTVRELQVDGVPRDVSWRDLVTAAVPVERANGRISLVIAPVDGAPARSQQSSDRSAPYPTTVRVTADPTANPESAVPLEVGGKIVDLSVNSRPENPDRPGSAPFYPG